MMDASDSTAVMAPKRAIKPGKAPAREPAHVQWAAERARILRRLCQRIEANVQAGSKTEAEIRKAARRWNGKPFKTTPGRKLKLSEETLGRVYRKWKPGHSEAAFELGYLTHGTTLPEWAIKQFCRNCSRAGITSRAEAVRATQAQWKRRTGKAFPVLAPDAHVEALGQAHQELGPVIVFAG